MARWAVFLAIFIAPFLLLRVPGVPQSLGRGISVAIVLLGGPVAVFWFGIKSQMIRPGAKLYQPKFARVRPRIEWTIRISVLSFGVFFFVVLTLPFVEDLLLLVGGEKPAQITGTLRYARRGSRGPVVEKIALSDENEEYTVYYPTKSLQRGDKYEFTVLPRSRIILDYRKSND